MPPTDADYLVRLAELERPFGYGDDRATARLIECRHHQVDVELRHEGTVVRWWLALPSSGRPMPWLMFHSADHPDGWLSDLRDWLSEEVGTVGIGSGAARRLDADGVVRVVTEGYGFRQADQINHVRLRGVIGPHGWSRRGPRWRYRAEYAVQWALDTVEETLLTVVAPPAPRVLDPLLPVTRVQSPDGTHCTVTVEAVGQGWELVARARRPGAPTARRRFGPVPGRP